MRRYNYDVNLDGFSLSKLRDKVHSATKKITRVAVGDPETILKITKGSLTNPKEQIKSDGQTFVDIHAKPVNELTLQLGPQRTNLLATIVAWIPVGGPIAAAALVASSQYNEYKKGKEAAELAEKLQTAYSAFDANFAQLSDSDKRRLAKIIESSQHDPQAMDGIVLAVQSASQGDKTALLKILSTATITPEQQQAYDALIEQNAQALIAQGMAPEAARAKAKSDGDSFMLKLQNATNQEIQSFVSMSDTLAINAEKAAAAEKSREFWKKAMPFVLAGASYLIFRS